MIAQIEQYIKVNFKQLFMTVKFLTSRYGCTTLRQLAANDSTGTISGAFGRQMVTSDVVRL